MKRKSCKHILAYVLCVLLACPAVPALAGTDTKAENKTKMDKQNYGIAYYKDAHERLESSPIKRPNSSIQIAFSSGEEYFGSQLSQEAKFIYDILRDNYTNMYDGINEIEAEVPSGLLYAKDVQYYYQYAIDALCADYPEIFWIDFSKLIIQYWSSSVDNMVTKVLFCKDDRYSSYYVGIVNESTYMNGQPMKNFGGELPFDDENSTKEAIQRVEQRVNECLKTIENCDSDYEKVKGIHDWLAANISYDYDYFDQSLYAALVQGKGVCAGYVSAFDYIAKKAGIETIQVSGLGHSTANQNENHAWNLVKMEGVWYELDLTWDDPKTGTVPYRDFFLVGTETNASILTGNPTFAASHEMFDYFTTAQYKFTFPSISQTAYVYSQNPNAPVKKGDVDSDGQIGLKDAQRVLRGALHLITLSDREREAADVNQDDNVNLQDAQLILRAALHLITEF